MITPNPQGVTRCHFWEVVANAKPTAKPHWSYDAKAAAKAKREAKRERLARALAEL